jgi:hypothetical protein
MGIAHLAVIAASVVAAWLIVRGYVAKKRLAAMRPAVERRLDLLIWAYTNWDLCLRGGVTVDCIYVARDKARVRFLYLTPSEGEAWRVEIHPRKGVRLWVPVISAESGRPRPPVVYPDRRRWSREPWLQAKTQHLLEAQGKIGGA